MKQKLIRGGVIAAAVLLLAAIIVSMSGVIQAGGYVPAWIKGKTSVQIEERYGAFDGCEAPMDEDGFYRDTVCYYVTKEKSDGWFGAKAGERLLIYFDETATAYKCTTQSDNIGG